MPRPTLVGDQWDECDRCGTLTPMHRFTQQNGLKLCDRPGCVDTLLGDRRDMMVAEELAADTEELTDRRVDLAFFDEGGDSWPR
jgi:hypothetical protein